MQFTIGDLIIMEIALVDFFKDIDLSLAVGKQIQETIARIEYSIAELQTATATQRTAKPVIENQKPSNQ